jgi:hypothetical protein
MFRILSSSVRSLPLVCRPFSFVRKIPILPIFSQYTSKSFSSDSTPKGGATVNKTKKIGAFILAGGILLGSVGMLSMTEPPSQHNATLTDSLNAQVVDVIKNAKDIPGLNSEEFASLKGDLIKAWETLAQKGVLEIEGADKDVRPIFVTLQAIMEHVLSCSKKEISSLKAVILTPLPPTPLCSKGEVSKELVDPSIEKDPKRLLTVTARTITLRNLLHQECRLYCVYEKSEGRTKEQLAIYNQECLNYAHLLDRPIHTHIPDSLIGATYFIKDNQGQSYAFGIKITQAKDPKDKADCALWYGPLTNKAVQARVFDVNGFISKHGIDTDQAVSKSLR